MARNSLIYFFQIFTSEVKIGVVKDFSSLKKRKIILQTGNHQELYLVRLLIGPREYEKWLHLRYKKLKKHIQGEWFEFDEDMITVIPPECSEVDIKEEMTYFEKKISRPWIKQKKIKHININDNVSRYFPELNRNISLNIR